MDYEFLKAESTGLLTEDHTALLPGCCEVWRKVDAGGHCFCHAATGLPHCRGHSRHSITGAVGTDGRHLTGTSIPLKASLCSQAKEGCPWGR